MFRDPRALAFVLLASGIGVLGWFGPQWYQRPKWSRAEIDQSVELNLAIELKQRGPLLQPTGDRLEQLRSLIRTEVEGQIRRERREVERWLGAGFLLSLFGVSAWLRARAARFDRSTP